MDAIWIVLSVFGTAICGFIASTKQRSPLPWAALGFFFPLIGVIAVCCVRSLNKLPEGASHLGQLGNPA